MITALQFSIKSIKKPQHLLGFCDLDWIQTIPCQPFKNGLLPFLFRKSVCESVLGPKLSNENKI